MNYLIWDFDDTLVRREGGWAGAILEALETESPGHEVTVEQIRPFLRAGFRWQEPHKTYPAQIPPDDWWIALYPLLLKAYCEGAQVEEVQARTLCARVRAAYLNPERWFLFPDVLPCLAALSASGWKHVILSNHVPELRTLMQTLNIASYFEAVFNSAETGVEKPHPQAFRNVLASIEGAAKVWMIGDNHAADVEGARSVGLPAVLVRKAHPAADLFCETLDDLPAFLRTHSYGGCASR
jgi:putative hydrolase of the HAD superfamily